MVHNCRFGKKSESGNKHQSEQGKPVKLRCPRDLPATINLNSAVETANHAKYANPKRLLERPHFTRWVKGLGGTNSISTLSFRVVRVVRGSSQLWFSGSICGLQNAFHSHEQRD
ncbi:MAG: hypothetical protein WCH99_14075 [Verrucomicrobiota bacterium]